MTTKYIEIDRAIETALLLLEEGEDEQTLAYNAALVAFIKNMENVPAADVEPKWIPCSDRLPEEDYETGNGVQFSGDVLATIVNHKNDGELYVWLLKTVNGKWYDYVPKEDGSQDVPDWCEVIAWMPLPEPYKGGEKK